jgi:hypothetical protein
MDTDGIDREALESSDAVASQQFVRTAFVWIAVVTVILLVAPLVGNWIIDAFGQ